MNDSGKRVAAPWPAVPANSATIVMFSTHDRTPTGGTTTFIGMRGELSVTMGANTSTPAVAVPYADIDAIEITWLLHNKAAAANGVRLYARDNANTWRESDHPDDFDVATIGAAAPETVAALTPPATKRLFIDVTRYIYGWAVEYTAGADNPENWAGCIALHLRSGAVIR